jgi:Predicted N-acetylglucosamine kinase
LTNINTGLRDFDMGYFVGIDGGGSKTDLLLCDYKGRIIKHIKGGCSNPVSIGGDRASQVVETLLLSAMDGIPIEDMEFISVCIPGIRHYINNIKVLAEFIENGKASVSGDDESAFYGALAGDAGIVILSGTGSFAIGINCKGEKASAGGWGPLVGDEGSGYYMGVEAIKAAIAWYEYFGPETLLTPMVMEHFNIKDMNRLKREVYRNGLDTRNIAALSRAVLKGAELNDAVSLRIIEQSAAHLFRLTDVVIRKLNLDGRSCKLSLTGGISNFGGFILNPLKEMLYEEYKNIEVVEPVFEPCVGSLIIALEKGGVVIDNTVLQNLKTTFKGDD